MAEVRFWDFWEHSVRNVPTLSSWNTLSEKLPFMKADNPETAMLGSAHVDPPVDNPADPSLPIILESASHVNEAILEPDHPWAEYREQQDHSSKCCMNIWTTKLWDFIKWPLFNIWRVLGSNRLLAQKCTFINTNHLNLDLQPSSVSSQIVNILGFERLLVSDIISQLYCCTLESSHR